MSKFFIKLCALTLVFVGVCLFFSSGSKVAAAVNCPAGDVVPDNWGTNAQDGPMDHGFGAVAVHSYYYDSSAKLHQLNVKYHLNSSLDHDGNPHYNIPGVVSNPDARIFQMPIPGGGRVQERWFGTGGASDDQLYAAPSSPDICPGWDELGVGTQGAIGNRFLLDCQEVDTNGVTHNNRFWVDQITAPDDPAATKYGGKWKIAVSTDGGPLQDRGSPPMSYTNAFAVVNGSNIRLNLEWIPNPPPPPPPPDVTSECNTLYVRDGGNWTRPSDGKVFGANDVRTKVRVEDTGGHALVHPANDNPSQYFYLNNEDRTWEYRPLARGVNVTVVREYRSSSGVWNFAQDDSRSHPNCYNATCSITAGGNVAGKPRGVKAGSRVSVTVTITNTGTLNLVDSLNGHGFVFYSDGGQTPGLQGLGIDLPPIGRPGTYPNPVTVSTVITVPSTAGHYHFSGSPVYPGLFYPGTSNCGYDVDVYQPFNAGLTSDTSLSPTRENPTTANYSSNVSISPSGPSVYIPTTSVFYKIPFGGGQQNLVIGPGGNYPPDHWAGSYGIPPGSFNAGDQFCAVISAAYTTGYIGPNGPGDVAETGTPNSSIPNCNKIVNEPYAHFFGNDVTAGGGFGKSCQKNQKGVIYTYNNTPAGAANSANQGGAGTQFGAHAMDIISGLGSANLRNGTPTGLSGLSFANSGDPRISTGADPSKTTGGYLGDAGLSNFCVPDYFSDKPDLLSANPNVPLTESTNTSATAGSGDAKQWYKPAGGTLTLNSGAIPNGFNQAIFVEGNVNIVGTGIRYDTAPRGSVKDIPSFYLVVKNGNIRIDRSVTQLDGVYVAQPNTADSDTLNKTGVINTCYIGTSFDGGNTQYNQCKNQLIINGAFVANRVMLARSHSSLRFSQSGEHNMGSFAAHNCGNPDKDVPAGSTSAPDCAGEIFNFSPELYMAQPSINARYGAPSGKFDAITSLSPVL